MKKRNSITCNNHQKSVSRFNGHRCAPVMGYTKFRSNDIQNMLALLFEVNGRLFQGHVIICYNRYDYYEIYLSNKNEVRCIMT